MERKRQKIWENLLPVSIGLLLYELAAESSFYLMELSLLLLAVAFVWEERGIFLHPSDTLHQMGSILAPQKWLWILLGCYLGWELVTLFYSVYREGVLQKYKVVVLMVGVCALILWYRQTRSADIPTNHSGSRSLLSAMTIAGIAAAVLSVFNFAFPLLYPVLYGRRLSLRLDYNLFSQVVLFGLIAGEYQMEGGRILCKKRLFLWLVCAPAVILSSSRRNTVFLLCFFLWMMLCSSVCFEQNGNFRWKFSVNWKAVLQWLAVFMGVIVLTGLMQVWLSWQYERMERQAMLENRELAAVSEASALERYEQIAQEGTTSKRKIIWSVAVKEYGDFPISQKIIGKGFGYDRLLYQKTDDKALLEAYAPESRSLLSAHCFVLADLLNSGLIGAGLGLLVWGMIGYRLWRMLLRGEKNAMFFAITLSITLANNLISNRYGFLYDKYFWVLIAMMG